MGTARKALRLATRVAGMINVEYKYLDQNYTASIIDYNGGLNSSLCSPAQGVGVSEREGDSIKVKNVTIKGAWKYNGDDSICRMIVFYDPDNTISSVSEFLDTVGSSLAVYANRNQTYKFSAKTLLDHSISITADNPIRQFKHVVNIDNHTNFTPAGTTIIKGAIKLLVISQAVTVNVPLFEYTTHATYVDN